MALLSDVREISFRFGPDIQEVQHLLRANHVDFGTPFDLPTVAQALESDPKLREDLTDLARSIMKREKNISLRTVLNIIAVASGGPQIATSEEDITQPINTLDDFLINVGGNPVNPQNTDSLSSELPSGGDRQEDRQDESHQAFSLTQAPLGHEAPLEQSDDDGDLDTLAPLDAPVHRNSQNVFAESLTRLELNSLQMKLYLDSIDQRISRMEPRLDSHPAYVAPPLPHVQRHATEERYSAAIASETIPPPPLDEPLPPQSVQTQSNESPEFHKLSKILSHPATDSPVNSSTPLFAIPVIAVLAAAALTALLYWSIPGNTSSSSIPPAVPPATAEPATLSTDLAPATTVPVSARPDDVTAPRRESHAVKPSPLRVSEPATSNSTTVRHQTPSSPAAIHPPPAALISAHPDTADYPSSTTSGPIDVSSGVMAANVLSAPQPAYPTLARLTRIHGLVVMRAIVSREGTIEQVHVIKGHRLLRGAATGAVRAWRYRPFRVEGRPVEVATIVSVDFQLPE